MTDQNAPDARHPDYVRAVLERSVAMMEAGRLDGADVLLKTLSSEPSAVEAVAYLRGVIASGLGEREAALSLFETALELNPHNADAHARLGALLLLEQRPVSAAAAFAAALALDAGRADWHFGFAEALRSLGFADLACDSFDEAHARGHAEAAQAAAGLRVQADDRREVADLSPVDEALLCDALFSEATRRLCAGDTARARSMYERVLKRAPSHLFTLCNLGALERAQDLAQSQALLERAIEIDAAFVPARLALAETHVAAGRAREARAQFSKAIELEPQSAAPHAAFAMGLQKLSAPKEAIEHFHRALMIDQHQSAEFYASLGAALEAMGLRDRAEIALQHAAALAQAS